MTQNRVVMEWDFDVIMQVDIDTAYEMAEKELRKRHGDSEVACLRAYQNGEYERIFQQIMVDFGYTVSHS